MSARSATTGRSADPRSTATTPVCATFVRTSRPSFFKRFATSAAVRTSRLPSSGCSCRSRRHATTCGSTARAARSTASRSCSAPAAGAASATSAHATAPTRAMRWPDAGRAVRVDAPSAQGIVDMAAPPPHERSAVFDPVRWPREAWVPLASGIAWNTVGVTVGLPWGVLALLPGTFLLGAGAGMLLHPGDRRLTHFAALGAVVGVLLTPFALAFAGWIALALAVASVASFLAAGYHALRLDAHPEGVPDPILTPRLAAQVAVDEAMLGQMTFTQLFPSADDHRRIGREMALAREQFSDAGWLDKPEAYHAAPPDPCSGEIVRRRTRGIDYEHLSFRSEYEPRAGEPGRDRWLAYGANRMGHAWVVRADPDAPWLVCLHGYRMGQPLIDLSAFHPSWLHRHHGLNLLVPVLPLHGPRSIGRRSGDGFLGGDLLDTVHAEAQAMWDLRRLLAWVRCGSDAPIGVYGLSLGGYTTALLASLDETLV